MYISIVIPALNEEQTIAMVIKAAKRGLKISRVLGEIIVADNNSVDRTAVIAKKHGAKVCLVKPKGYGITLRRGISAARGEYIIIGDADCSYDLANLTEYIKRFEYGYDFVIGNRFKGIIEPGAMPCLHRFLGTPLLTVLVNILFGTKIHDINCGLRGFTKKAFLNMHCRCTGMELASEMVIAAAKRKYKIAEVPCDLYKDQRNHPSHLRIWSDGWRHLKLILYYYFTKAF